jgi:type IV secretion system protein VirD4
VVKALRILAGIILSAILLGLMFGYLSSALFVVLYTLNFDVHQVGLLRTFEYARYYWTDHAVRWRLVASWSIAGLIVAAPIIGMVALLIRKLLAGEKLFGDAKWATPEEVQQAGLLGVRGIIVGKYKGRYLMFDGQQFVLLYAPTRSGKGVSCVVPNCLNWPDSLVALDIKPELWRLTSGFRRKHGQECYQFSPLSPNTHGWNPLHYISEDRHRRITDIQQIANMLCPDRQGVDPIWTATPRKLFLGVVLYLLETPGVPVTLGEVLRQLSTAEDTASYFTRVINERADSEIPLSFPCTQALLGFIGIESEKTRSGVKESLTSTLELWMNPVIDAATSRNDFDLRDLRKRRMSIYLCLQPDQLLILAPLINLFYQQVFNLNTNELPEANPELKYQVLFVNDEFPSIGKIGIVAKANAYIAGFGLRLLTICQSPAQIRSVYGADDAESFFDNHAVEIIFRPKNFKIAKEISEKLGTKTVDSMSRSRPHLGGKGGSNNTSQTGRPLVMPQELRKLGKGYQILMHEEMDNPLWCNKIVYHKDRNFKSRLMKQAPVPTLDMTRVESRLAELQAQFMGVPQEAAASSEPEASEFVDVTIENLDTVAAAPHTINLSDLDFPEELAERLPEVVASEEEVDALVKLFMSEAEAA